MSDIEARVKKIIAEQLGVEEGQVTHALGAAGGFRMTAAPKFLAFSADDRGY